MGNRKSVESSSSKIIFQTMVMSDMHLEIENRVIPEFPAAAPNLILAGDIGRPDITRFSISKCISLITIV